MWDEIRYSSVCRRYDMRVGQYTCICIWDRSNASFMTF